MSDVVLLISENNLTVSQTDEPMAVIINNVPATAAPSSETPLSIKAKYESNPDTNAFTDAEQTKLAGIEESATADQTPAEILAAVLTVDGSGSGLDADLLDGNDSTYFAPQSTTYTVAQVDALLSNLTTGLDWKEAVATFGDIATTYPSPDDGWAVTVLDENKIYQYHSTQWEIIAEGVVPLATAVLDGKLASTDFQKLELITEVTSALSIDVDTLTFENATSAVKPYISYTGDHLWLKTGDDGNGSLWLQTQHISFRDEVGTEYIDTTYDLASTIFEAKANKSFRFFSDITDANVLSAGMIFDNKNITTKDITSFQSNSVEKAKIDSDGSYYTFNGAQASTVVSNTGVKAYTNLTGGDAFNIQWGIWRIGLLGSNSSNPYLKFVNTGTIGWSNDVLTADTSDTGLARDSAGVLKVTDGSTGTGDLISGNILTDGVWFSGTLGGTATADTFIYESSTQKITAQADNGFQFNIGASRFVDFSFRGLSSALRLSVTGAYEGIIQAGDHAGLSYKARIDDANNLIAHNFENDVNVPVGSHFMKWTVDITGTPTDIFSVDDNYDWVISGNITTGNKHNFSNNVTLYNFATNVLDIQLGGITYHRLNSSIAWELNSTTQITWGPGFGDGIQDVGIARDSEGKVRITNASTSQGDLAAGIISSATQDAGVNDYVGEFQFGRNGQNKIWTSSFNQLDFQIANSSLLSMRSAWLKVPSSMSLQWSSTGSSSGIADTGLERDSAGVLKVTDGSTGTGSIIADNLTAEGVTSANSLTFTTSGTANLVLNGNNFTYKTNFRLYNNTTILDPTNHLQWATTSVTGAVDIGLARDSAGVLKVTDGSTGTGQLVARKPYRAETTPYTTVIADEVVNCTSGTFTVTLISAVGIEGKQFIIKNSGTGAITVDGNGAETIDGATTATLNQYDSITVVSDGTNWIII